MLAIEMRRITKRFGNLLANDAINLEVESGTIHALVGENGAGKSTLMKILYGIYQPEFGEIIINGKKEIINSASKAITVGIGMVHQHFMLIPTLTIAENIILGSEPISKFNIIDLSKAETAIDNLSETYSLKIDPQTKVETLSVGLQQRVEILKVLYRKANILILDEPTQVLTPQEVDELFTTLNDFKKQGKTVILITHKLKEVTTISDSVTVLQHGKMIVQVKTKSTTKEELARFMIGKEIKSLPPKQISTQGAKKLVVENISALNDRHLPALQNVSFTISKGEIFGIAAVEGNGQSELVEVLTGIRQPTKGKIIIDGVELQHQTLNKMVAHIPEDRHKRGLVLGFILSENLLLGRHRENTFSNNLFLSKSKINYYADTLIKKFDIRPPDKNQTARGLSGGNQQKAVIARELSKDTPVIITSQPTRGLDISATRFVHDALLAERNKGKAILLVTSDLEELLQLSDRIAVMYEGKIIVILNSSEASEQELGTYMTGARKNTAS